MENNNQKEKNNYGASGAVVMFFLFLFFYSKFGPSIPFSVLSQQKGEPLVSEGTGKVAVAPDIAKISVGIDQNGSSLKSVQDSVNDKSKVLVDALEDLGVDEKNIKTTSYNVYPQYDYSSSTQRITGYNVSTNYQVIVEDFDKVNDIIVAATNAGANVVGNISFEINEETKKEKLQEARDLAVKEAKEKAEGLAKASGINLGKVINVSEDQGFPDMREISARPISFDADTKEISPANIQPGETEISVNVMLFFEVR